MCKYAWSHLGRDAIRLDAASESQLRFLIADVRLRLYIYGAYLKPEQHDVQRGNQTKL